MEPVEILFHACPYVFLLALRKPAVLTELLMREYKVLIPSPKKVRLPNTQGICKSLYGSHVRMPVAILIMGNRHTGNSSLFSECRLRHTILETIIF